MCKGFSKKVLTGETREEWGRLDKGREETGQGEISGKVSLSLLLQESSEA